MSEMRRWAMLPVLRDEFGGKGEVVVGGEHKALIWIIIIRGIDVPKMHAVI